MTIVTPEAYGAVGDGVTIDTAAVAAAFATGNSVRFSKKYLLSSTINIVATGQHIFGEGPDTVILTNQAFGDVFSLVGSGFELDHIAFQSTVPRTANAFINLNATNTVNLHDFYMNGFFEGIAFGTPTVANNGIIIERGQLLTGVAGGVGVKVTNNCVLSTLRDLVIEGNGNVGAETQLLAGIWVMACGDLLLDHIETVWAGNGLLVTPPADAVVQALWVTNSFFDTGSGWGIYVFPSGSVQLLKVTHTWSASNAGGMLLATEGTGTIQQTDIMDCVISNNTSHGLQIYNSGVSNTKIIGGSMSANGGDGINIQSDVIRFSLRGVTMGASGEFAGNVGHGLNIQPGCSKFIIDGCTTPGNTAGMIALGAPSGVSGVDWISVNNIGG